MSLTILCSQKGSPGTSLTAMALAATWPAHEGRTRLLLEADPSGGVLALRYGLGREPGLLTLATAVRHGSATSGDILENAQALPGGLLTIVAPEHSSSIEAAFRAAGTGLGKALSEARDLDVIVDIGRLTSGSPASSLLSFADAVFMVARPTPEQIVPGAEQLRGVHDAHWCLIGERPYSPDQVAETFGIPAFVIADDERGAQAIESGGSAKKVRRSDLVRSARELAEAIDAAVNPAILGSVPPRPVMAEAPPPPSLSNALIDPVVSPQ